MAALCRERLLITGKRIYPSGFRGTIREFAEDLKVTGAAKNIKKEEGGIIIREVEIVCEGELEALKEFRKKIEEINKFNEYFSVEHIKEEEHGEISKREYKEFKIIEEKGEKPLYDRVHEAAYFMRTTKGELTDLRGEIKSFSEGTGHNFDIMEQKYGGIHRDLNASTYAIVSIAKTFSKDDPRLKEEFERLKKEFEKK